MLREDFGRFGSFMEMHRRHRARIENMMNSLMADSFPQSENCGCNEASRLFDKGKYNQAAVAWKKYAKQLQDSFHEETRNEATALVWEGYSYYKAKRFKEARIAWRKALGIYSRVAPNDENIAFVNQHLRLIRAQAGRLEPSSQS